ncbi:MAG TPA: citramalate synthase [Candidatus Dormibacteraeota bacterium]|nr:citramalate synthase [Candidatus Dormibacteraeota bacterium]
MSQWAAREGPATGKLTLYDTTLRDGMQGFGLQLSVEQKLKVARRLDALGVAYIEAGWPGANPRDTAVFERLAKAPLRQARLAAFGSTCRPGVEAAADRGLALTLGSGAPVVTVVGKSSRWQVEAVLGTTPEENLRMVEETVAYAVAQGREVIFDAEHFFDGRDQDEGYTLAVVEAAAQAGASWVVLCDTNGGQLPAQVGRVTEGVRARLQVALGIHCHNDAGVGVANSLAAVAAGATMVQGTLNGSGERCGNADLLVIAANLQLKLGRPVLDPERLQELVSVSRLFDALVNRAPDPHRPYVGPAAFLHKGGLHAQAVARDERAYQHIDPALVGNEARTVVSDQSGRSNVASKLHELGLAGLDRDARGSIVDRLKELETAGWAFEDADASFELLVIRGTPGDQAPFALQESLVVAHETSAPRAAEPSQNVQASVKVMVSGTLVHTAAEAAGPVEALDLALRRALAPHFPSLASVQLLDYRVRVIDGDQGTGATVRVGIDSSDGERVWTTVGCSANILQASALALVDSYEWAARHAASLACLSPTG